MTKLFGAARAMQDFSDGQGWRDLLVFKLFASRAIVEPNGTDWKVRAVRCT
jgi:hypothetical protein